MSRRAIISDIHSNLLALQAVLADIKTQHVDEIVCLGDICGYGPQPIECVDLVRQNCSWCLMGNHDEALFVDPTDFGQNAKVAIEWQRTIMQPTPDSPPEIVERWEWLKSLVPEHKENDVVFVHASPRDPIYEYVLREDFHDSGLGPTQRAKDIFGAMEWLAFCGHSHRPGVVAEDYHWYVPDELDNRSSIIKRGYKTIVNVGSVGQPRDGNPDACYVLFDYEPQTAEPQESNGEEAMKGSMDDTRFGEELAKARETALLKLPRVTYRRVNYDVQEAIRRFKTVPELPESNATRLERGQ